MIRSMTAFARAETQNESGAIVWEIRSVNHRYLEASIRLPEAFRVLEPSVRERINGHLNRGKIECTLKFQPGVQSLAGIHLNHALATRLLEVAGEVEQLMGPGASLRTIDILRWPDVVSQPMPDLESIQEVILQCLETGLAELVATREREGARILDMMGPRCSAIREQVGFVRERREKVLQHVRDRLLKRIADLPVEADPGRVEQELVLLTQRLDVEEELDRLDAHVSEIEQVLRRKEPVGRRLDFLMQELNREANTLASKSADTETTRASTEIKVAIEQMREQIQNVE